MNQFTVTYPNIPEKKLPARRFKKDDRRGVWFFYADNNAWMPIPASALKHIKDQNGQPLGNGG